MVVWFFLATVLICKAIYLFLLSELLHSWWSSSKNSVKDFDTITSTMSTFYGWVKYIYIILFIIILILLNVYLIILCIREESVGVKLFISVHKFIQINA